MQVKALLTLTMVSALGMLYLTANLFPYGPPFGSGQTSGIELRLPNDQWTTLSVDHWYGAYGISVGTDTNYRSADFGTHGGLSCQIAS
jgi:hypothetical protein